ncbi:MAG: hypothetical protein UX91_C0006G0040 [Candidatus Amesbacteria bacterium GW2011_GWB1_47_19]|nr:MAG: hypothetical protein UW51_C0002G0040 [Candidatus Amesbacteria bacterium GW2011_GWA1_44_24]KKU31369.1 MAG: hypothetical protein UX46_C0006G0161 [Candidatus Amesbacteria bacterium GW2011_GWC1_46_24]KKU66978.1 MAG: hypothetical protein UX91_C0006G0040 [Candidatus Amesbacteria bacterium GW2011_GWB1_47_19]OGD05689.1 MAG: hypothetical protein A2379_05585 [Candidatus Amesbacteria bacterium RIFOXYB1_FULL_47_13]HBC72804.1 hypothetical protein [Candidatus Amesbacteria bacterium]
MINSKIKSFRRDFFALAVLIACLIGGLSQAVLIYLHQRVIYPQGDYSQPTLPASDSAWSIRSIDTQVISKHWPDVSARAIAEQVKLVADLGVNYIAVGTPYDRVDELYMWADAIHARGLHVWFRSHWADWEGDEGQPATLNPEEYLARTERFIKANPGLFLPGDAFTLAVEAENVGVGLGKRFLNWDQYRHFLLSQITVSNRAFASIGLKQQIHTNWISINGWVVENQLTQEVVDKMGIITVDHFVSQSNTIGLMDDPFMVTVQTLADLDKFYRRWRVPVFLGEWGYQIFQPVSDQLQAEVITLMYSGLREKQYLVGVNYWVHMGNTASLIGDEFGSNLTYRPAADVVKTFFTGKPIVQ